MSKRLLFALAGLAALSNNPAMAAAPVGDAEAGAAKAATCAACHGMDGNSPAPQWPKLAGQHPDYVQRQAALVRDGHREVIEMMPFVQGLSDQDLADIGAYYAAQTVMPGVADDSPIAGLDDQTYAGLGEAIYRAGKPEAGVPACTACHGPSGNGVPGAGFPGLAGQHGTYTAARLRFFHAGGHYGDDGDRSMIMTTIAQRLDETEIDAVATYIEGLHRATPGAATTPAAVPASAPSTMPAPADPATGAADGDATGTSATRSAPPGTGAQGDPPPESSSVGAEETAPSVEPTQPATATDDGGPETPAPRKTEPDAPPDDDARYRQGT